MTYCPRHRQLLRTLSNLPKRGDLVLEDMSLTTLPHELLLEILDLVSDQKDVYAFTRSCRRLYYPLRKYLLQYNVRHSGGSALVWAAANDRRSLVQRLLRLRADVNTLGETKCRGTPLHAAAARGYVDMVRLLLNRVGDPEMDDHRGRKPLFLALDTKHEDIAICLFRTMSDPDSRLTSSGGFTSLHIACLRKLPKSARVFLEAGADVCARTERGNTPLHLALRPETLDNSDNINNTNDTTSNFTIELVVLLLDFGSDKVIDAYYLGLRHPDPRIRRIFGAEYSVPNPKLDCTRIGRPWSAGESPHSTCLPSSAPDPWSRPPWLLRLARTGESIMHLTKGLVNDEMFPTLDVPHSLQQKTPWTSEWDTSKATEIREAMLVAERNEETTLLSGLQVELFPKLIGRQSPHPLESAAQTSWTEMRTTKTRVTSREAYITSDSKTEEKLQGAKKSRKRRWMPLQVEL